MSEFGFVGFEDAWILDIDFQPLDTLHPDFAFSLLRLLLKDRILYLSHIRSGLISMFMSLRACPAISF